LTQDEKRAIIFQDLESDGKKAKENLDGLIKNMAQNGGD